MAKYEKKPEIIEAELWDGTNKRNDIIKNSGNKVMHHKNVAILPGKSVLDAGDSGVFMLSDTPMYIITRADGSVQLASVEWFEANYRLVK